MHQIFPCIPSGESTEPPALPPPPGTKLLDLPDALIGSIFTQLQGDRKSRRALLHSCQALHQSDHCRQQVCLCVFVCMRGFMCVYVCANICVCMFVLSVFAWRLCCKRFLCWNFQLIVLLSVFALVATVYCISYLVNVYNNLLYIKIQLVDAIMVWLVAIWTVHTSNKLKWLQFRACQVAFTDWRLGDRISTSSLNLLWTRQYSEQGSSTSKGCFWLAYYVSVMLGSNNDLIWFVAFTFLFYEAVSAGCNYHQLRLRKVSFCKLNQCMSCLHILYFIRERKQHCHSALRLLQEILYFWLVVVHFVALIRCATIPACSSKVPSSSSMKVTMAP